MSSTESTTPATKHVLQGDELLAKHAAEAHLAMRQCLLTAERRLREVDLAGWTGAAGDKARLKLSSLRKLMTAQAAVLNEAALGSSTTRGLVSEQRRVLDEVTTAEVTPGAAAAGVAVQATGTVIITWMTFGLVVEATMTISKALEGRIPETVGDGKTAAAALATRIGAFLAGHFIQGLLSGVFFEATAAGISGAPWDGRRIALLASSYTGAEVVGWSVAGALGTRVQPGSVAVSVGGALSGGATAGLLGPTLVSYGTGTKIPWMIWQESAALAVAGANAVVFLHRLMSAKDLIMAARNRIFS